MVNRSVTTTMAWTPTYSTEVAGGARAPPPPEGEKWERNLEHIFGWRYMQFASKVH